MIQFLTGPFLCFIDYFLTNYVELFKQFILINSPSYMWRIWKLIRPILPSKTWSKIHVFSSEGWKEKLLEYIDVNRLPSHYGGILQNEKILFPEPIPRDLYRIQTEEEREFLNSPHLQSLTIRAGRVEFITVKVENPGSVISVRIITDRQFGHGVFYSEKAEEADTDRMEMICPQFSQVPVALVPYKESFFCPKPGFYKFWLSNQNAWFFKLKANILVEISS